MIEVYVTRPSGYEVHKFSNELHLAAYRKIHKVRVSKKPHGLYLRAVDHTEERDERVDVALEQFFNEPDRKPARRHHKNL